MKLRIFFYSLAVLLCSLFFSEIATAQTIVDKVDISSEDAKVKLSNDTPSSYLVEIGGPDQYYSKQTVDFTTEISLSNINAKGEKFRDGLYSLQITPVYTLTEEQRTDLAEMRANNDEEGMSAYRRENNLPVSVDVFSMNFSIRNGEFVISTQQEGKLNLPTMSSQWEINHPSLYASLNTVGLDYPDHAMDNTALTGASVAQTFTTDVIVQGSLCVGVDCSSSESFGFDTERLKENNLRIHFQDTSVSASFPTTDWRITINDSSNGGANYFAVEDASAGRVPFRIEGGAPANSLVVESDGDIGIGTINPVVEVHVADGDTPTLRMEQNGSSGFTAQTWDVAGNETNFFIRDVTNGSELPFKIRPGADDNTLVLDSDNNVGIGILNANAEAKLHINATSSMIVPLGTDAQRPGSPTEGMLRGNNTSNILEYYNGSSWLDLTSGGTGGSVWSTSGADVYYNGGNVGIGTTAPQDNLHVEGILRIGLNGAIRTVRQNADPHTLFFMDMGDDMVFNPTSLVAFGNRPSAVVMPVGSGKVFDVRDNNNTVIMRADNDTKNVGIDELSPSFKLEIGSGDAAKPGGGQWATASDRRLKKDVRQFTDGLEQVLQINPVFFRYNGKAGYKDEKEYVGVIAQEIQEVAPYTVKPFTRKEVEMTYSREAGTQEVVKSEGEYLSYDGTAIQYMLINAVKEQQAIIDAQQAEINSLKEEVASLQELKAQVAELAQMVMKQNGQGNQTSSED